MFRFIRYVSYCAAAMLLGSLAGNGVLRAEIIVGLTAQNSLITFDSGAPGAIGTAVSVSGLVAGDTLIGIDQRPSLGPNNGVLYGVGVNAATGTGRIYMLNSATGVASQGPVLAADPTDTTAPFPFASVMGSSFGMDFNPVPDRLRVTSNTGQNLRINVDSGLVQLDVPLAYESGDVNFGSIPDLTAIAYSNNFGGATTTTLRGVDLSKSPDLLVTVTNPNGGTLQTTLMLPFDSTSLIGYDVSGLTGTPFFSVTLAGGPSLLYGAGPGGVTLLGTIGGGVGLVDIAAQVGAPVPEPSTLIFSAAGIVMIALGRRRRAS